MADNPSKSTEDTTPTDAVGQAVDSVSYASLVPLRKNTCSSCFHSAGGLSKVYMAEVGDCFSMLGRSVFDYLLFL